MKTPVLMILVLTLASALSADFLSLVPLMAVCYGLSFFLLRSFDYGEDFYLSFNARKDLKPSAPILVAGQVMTSNIQADQQEDRFLSFFETSRMVKRRLLGVLIPISGGLFLHFHYRIAPGFNTVIPLLCCYLLVSAFYVGHLYVILALNLFLALSNISHETSSVLIIAYALGFLVVLHSLTNKEQFIKNMIPRLILMGGIYITLCWGINQLVKKPDPQSTKEQPSVQLSGMTKQQLHQFLLSQQSLSLDVNEALARIENSPQFSNEHAALSEELKLHKAKISHMEELAAKPELSPEQYGELGAILKELEDNQGRIEKRLTELSSKAQQHRTISEEEYQNLSSVLAEQGERELTDQEKEIVKDFLEKKQNDPSMPQSLAKEVEDFKAQAGSLNSPKLLDTQKLVDQVLKFDQKQLEQKLQQAQMSTSDQSLEADLLKEQLSKPMDEQKKPAQDRDWMRKIKPLLLLAGLFLLMRFFLKKKGIKQVSAADPEILQELVQKWKQIRKRSFTPREEVIHYYHLFHESLQKIHYAKIETPPSCIVASEMEHLNPELTKATKAVTEIFAQCFYGDKEVSKDALALFRRGLKRILVVYQLD